MPLNVKKPAPKTEESAHDALAGTDAGQETVTAQDNATGQQEDATVVQHDFGPASGTERIRVAGGMTIPIPGISYSSLTFRVERETFCDPDEADATFETLNEWCEARMQKFYDENGGQGDG